MGNERLIAALVRVKSYLDYAPSRRCGWRRPSTGRRSALREIRRVYKARRDCLVESFGRARWPIPWPRASMFAWAPEPFGEFGSVEFAKMVIDAADVAVSPGLGFGEYGEGYVRIAPVENEHRIRQAARGIKKFLARPHKTMHNVIPLAQTASR
jgi:alanine-synthesizing transaminase